MNAVVTIVKGICGLGPLNDKGLKDAAGACFIVSTFFIIPLIFFDEHFSTLVKVVAQVLWALVVWRGAVLLNRREKLQKGQGGR